MADILYKKHEAHVGGYDPQLHKSGNRESTPQGLKCAAQDISVLGSCRPRQNVHAKMKAGVPHGIYKGAESCAHLLQPPNCFRGRSNGWKNTQQKANTSNMKSKSKQTASPTQLCATSLRNLSRRHPCNFLLLAIFLYNLSMDLFADSSKS